MHIAILLLIVYIIISTFITLFEAKDLHFFNPIRNYKKWKTLNFLGVGIITILLHILLPVLAIIYWIYILFTIGRKKEN